jgi:membrane peptidoglycan carboxypeptidase
MPSPRIVRWGAAAAVVVLVSLAGTVAYYGNEVRVARAETGAVVAQAWRVHGKRLSFADLTPARRDLLLAVEDPAFFSHRGVDLHTPGAGMTTITQGLVKLLYFPGGFRQGIAKIRQTLIAQYALDAQVSKQDQLDLLLNIAYLGSKDGRAVHGFAEAAQAYYGRDFAQLSDREFQSLVAMLIAPNRYVPGSPAHAERMRRLDAYLAGRYRPASLLDVEYDGTAGGTAAEEALMALLRLVTDSRPGARARQQEAGRAGAVTP